MKHCSEGVNLANMANCPFLENVPPQIGIICSAIIQYAILSKREIYGNYQNMLLHNFQILMWQESNNINLPSLAFKSDILQKGRRPSAVGIMRCVHKLHYLCSNLGPLALIASH